MPDPGASSSGFLHRYRIVKPQIESILLNILQCLPSRSNAAPAIALWAVYPEGVTQTGVAPYKGLTRSNQRASTGDERQI